ncbi:MAG: hypothetical protein QXT13_09695 [Pyrobaculum sp.]
MTPAEVLTLNVWHIIYVALILGLVLTPVRTWPFGGVAIVVLSILLNMPSFLIAIGIIMAFVGIVKAIRE